VIALKAVALPPDALLRQLNVLLVRACHDALGAAHHAIMLELLVAADCSLQR
jgi:hypothetical protein